MLEPKPSPVREFADHATLWLLESPENLRDLLRLVATEIAERLDFRKAERLNRSFIPDNLQKQEADLLFRVPYREGKREVWIYLLVEHQSKPDRLMGLRLLSYMVQIWETQVRGWEDARTPKGQRRLHPIVPMVFYTGRRRWSSPLSLLAAMDLPADLVRFVPAHETLFLKLQETPAEVLTQAGSALAYVLRVMQVADEPREVLLQVLEGAIGFLEGLPAEAQAEWRRAMQFLLQLIVHKRDVTEHERFREMVIEAAERRQDQEVSEMAKTAAEVYEERGRKQGWIEGRREGEIEGRREGKIEGQRKMLLQALEFRFGTVPEEVRKTVEALSEPQLAEYLQRALEASSLAEVGLVND